MPVSSDTASYRASASRQVLKPVAWGTGATLVLLVLIVVGSRKLAHFDAALVGYTFSVLFATFGLTYRYAMWLQRPPTAVYWRRGWQAFFRRGLATAQRRHVGPARRRRRARQSLHLRAGPAARAHAHADHVGLPARGGDHLSARLRLAALPAGAGDLSMYEAVAFGFPAFRFPHDRSSGSSSFTAWCGRRSWSSPA